MDSPAQYKIRDTVERGLTMLKDKGILLADSEVIQLPAQKICLCTWILIQTLNTSLNFISIEILLQR